MGGVTIDGLIGRSAGRKVVLGFAPARTLHALSFADILNEDSGEGYQRRFNPQHSLDFRRYIQRPCSTTIPLTFNLRPCEDEVWRIIEGRRGQVRLEVRRADAKVLAQVDCQHRLGHLADLEIELPFMCFVGLSPHDEMEIFNVINSKAKGLSKSLLDFHDAQLSADLAGDRPELYIALLLKNDDSSPWYQQLDLGGESTSGMSRRASLRTVQKAVKVFLARTRILKTRSPDEVARIVLDFWAAVALVLGAAWRKPRTHLVTKGIGVYALMEIAADLVNEANGEGCDRRYFEGALSDFAPAFNWSNEGPLRGLGGQSGVKAAVGLIRDARKKARFKVVANG